MWREIGSDEEVIVVVDGYGNLTLLRHEEEDGTGAEGPSQRAFPRAQLGRLAGSGIWTDQCGGSAKPDPLQHYCRTT
jgi:hypothetical protein